MVYPQLPVKSTSVDEILISNNAHHKKSDSDYDGVPILSHKSKPAHAPSYITSVDRAKCPHCRSLVWVKVHRSWWQRLLHPQQNLCFCRDCRQQFWQSAQ